jgi:hypothetical protein
MHDCGIIKEASEIAREVGVIDAPRNLRGLGVALQTLSVSTCGGKRMRGTLAQSAAGLPLVTVVTAVLNGQHAIQGCLEGVLKQDYPNIEHIVLDGGSTDGTLDVLRQYDDRIALW